MSFFVGDKVQATGDNISSFYGIPAGREFEVITRRNGRFTARIEDPDFGVRQYDNLDMGHFKLVTPVEGRPEPGNTIQLLRDCPAMGWREGARGELVAIDSNGQPYVKMDEHNDAGVFFGWSDFKVIEASSERQFKERADAAKATAHPGRDHAWTAVWDHDEGKCQRCTDCGVLQWHYACWTARRWQFKIPRAVVLRRPDLDKSLLLGDDVPFYRTAQPFRTRSMDVIPENILSHPITIIGAGAIGSFTALLLVKMGFNEITIWDGDMVAIENVGTQLYGESHANYGYYKTQALQNILSHLGPSNRAQENYRFTEVRRRYEGEELRGLVIMAVDSMEARSMIWAAQKYRPAVSWVIDGRMGAEQALMYAKNPCDDADVATYEKTLYSDSESLQESCTARGTVYTASLIAGTIVKAVKDALSGQNYSRVVLWNIAMNQQHCYGKAANE